MKSVCKSFVLAGAILGSSAGLVSARLGSENDNADSEAKLQTSKRRRLELLDQMFSGMVEGAGALDHAGKHLVKEFETAALGGLEFRF